MPVMDEFKEEREALKHGTPKEKLQYFWDYYKWPTAILLFVALLVFLFVKDIVTKRDIQFYACLLNGAQIDSMAEETPVETTFTEILELNAKKERVYFDTSIQIGRSTNEDYVNIQKLMVYMSSSEIDVMISDVDSLIQYIYQDGFADLNTVLRPDQIEKYKDNFVYMDMAYFRELREDKSLETNIEQLEYPDPTKPELMKEPVAIGFYPIGSTPIDKDFVFGKKYLICIMKNSKHPDYCLQFVDFLSQK